MVEVRLSGRTLEDWGLAPFLSSVRCSRTIDRTPRTVGAPKGRQRRDSAELTFENVDDGVWHVLFVNELVEIRLGYMGGPLFLRGTYIVREPKFHYPEAGGLTVTLTCEDESLDLMRNFVARRWMHTRLEDVVRRVADANGMEAVVHESLAGVTFPEIASPCFESDWDLMERIVRLTGAGFIHVEPSTEGAKAKLVVEPFTFRRALAPGTVTAGPSDTLRLGYRDPYADVFVTDVDVTLDGDAIQKFDAHDISAQSGRITAAHGLMKGENTLLEGVQDDDSGGGPAGSAGPSSSAVRTLQGRKARRTLGSLPIDLPEGVIDLRAFEESTSLWESFGVRIKASVAPGAPFLYPGHVARLTGMVGPFVGAVAIMGVTDSWDGSYKQSLDLRASSALDGLADGSVGSRGRLVAGRGTAEGQNTVMEAVPDGDAAALAEGGGVGE